MINRIRDIRRQKKMTLADVAERCVPPTTAQTIGRLETGMRSLSLSWMNRIAAALGVEPELLVRSEESATPQLIVRLTARGAEALTRPTGAVLPSDLAGKGRMVVMHVESSAGDYRESDQIWLRKVPSPGFERLLNRDVLAPYPGGNFAFGRMIDHDAAAVTLLPPGTGQRPIRVEAPEWLAVAEMLVRRL